MKQLSLPLNGIEESEKSYHVYELYLCAPSTSKFSKNRTYCGLVDYTIAESQNQAEEFLQRKYPEWWKTMAVRKVGIEDVKTKMTQLENQLETCKVIMAAVTIL